MRAQLCEAEARIVQRERDVREEVAEEMETALALMEEQHEVHLQSSLDHIKDRYHSFSFIWLSCCTHTTGTVQLRETDAAAAAGDGCLSLRG